MPTFWSSLSPLSFAIAVNRANQRNATTRHDAFFDGRTRCVQRIFDASFLLFHLDFGRSANLDDSNTAGELGNALLQLFLVVVGGDSSISRLICSTRP